MLHASTVSKLIFNRIMHSISQFKSHLNMLISVHFVISIIFFNIISYEKWYHWKLIYQNQNSTPLDMSMFLELLQRCWNWMQTLHIWPTKYLPKLQNVLARRLRAKFLPDCAIPDTNMKIGTVVDHNWLSRIGYKTTLKNTYCACAKHFFWF